MDLMIKALFLDIDDTLIARGQDLVCDSALEAINICRSKGIKIIVMRNGRLGMVRELQKNLYDSAYSGVFLDGSPDFVRIAQAYGIRSRCVSTNEEAMAAVDEMLSDDQPYLLECVVPWDYPSL